MGLVNLAGSRAGVSPAKRTLEAVGFTHTLQGWGQAKPCGAWLPSPSGGEDCPAPGAGIGVGAVELFWV